MSETSFRALFERAEESLSYHVEGAIIDFTEELCRVMDAKGVSRAELARRIETSPAYVTKILRGRSNFTLASIVRVAHALGHEIHIHMAPKGAMTRWIDQLPAVAVSSASSTATATAGAEGAATRPAPLIEAA